MISSLIKKYWQAFVIIVLIAVLFLSVKSCNDLKENLKNTEAAGHYNDSLYRSKMKEWRDEEGRLHKTVDNIFVSYFQLKYTVDSISELLHIKNNQIISLSETRSTIKIHERLRVDTFLKKVPCDGDSIYIASEYDLSWRDQWMEVRGQLNGVNDSIAVTGMDSLRRVDYWKRKWFLGAKRYYSDFYNVNPHIEIDGYKGVQFRQNEKKWTVALGGGMGYQFINIQTKPTAFFGVFAGYSLFNF